MSMIVPNGNTKEMTSLAMAQGNVGLSRRRHKKVIEAQMLDLVERYCCACHDCNHVQMVGAIDEPGALHFAFQIVLLMPVSPTAHLGPCTARAPNTQVARERHHFQCIALQALQLPSPSRIHEHLA